MELQINQFWFLKGHSMINSVSEYESCVLNTHVQHGIEKFYKECMSSLALLPPIDFAVFEKQFLYEY